MTAVTGIFLSSLVWGLLFWKAFLVHKKELGKVAQEAWEYRLNTSKEIQEMKQIIHSLKEEAVESKRINVSYVPFQDPFSDSDPKVTFVLKHNAETLPAPEGRFSLSQNTKTSK